MAEIRHQNPIRATCDRGHRRRGRGEYFGVLGGVPGQEAAERDQLLFAVSSHRGFISQFVRDAAGGHTRSFW